MPDLPRLNRFRGPYPGQAILSFALALMVVSLLVLFTPAVAPPWRLELPERERPVTVTIGGVNVVAELADEPEEQSQGLGNRDGLMPGTGMLFAFPDVRSRSFWMYGMRFCLDIIWIEDGAVIGAAESVCPSPVGTDVADLPRFSSPGPVSYVLEVPAGFMDEHGLGIGTMVEFEPDPKTLSGERR
ncbi:MAG TPA: DUF192 domain-containing protein [Thermomicrobiales bacterium]|nr:DUF192 domain-containing protein [Thermomicrobiales bacterium]